LFKAIAESSETFEVVAEVVFLTSATELAPNLLIELQEVEANIRALTGRKIHQEEVFIIQQQEKLP